MCPPPRAGPPASPTSLSPQDAPPPRPHHPAQGSSLGRRRPPPSAQLRPVGVAVAGPRRPRGKARGARPCWGGPVSLPRPAEEPGRRTDGPARTFPSSRPLRPLWPHTRPLPPVLVPLHVRATWRPLLWVPGPVPTGRGTSTASLGPPTRQGDARHTAAGPVSPAGGPSTRDPPGAPPVTVLLHPRGLPPRGGRRGEREAGSGAWRSRLSGDAAVPRPHRELLQGRRPPPPSAVPPTQERGLGAEAPGGGRTLRSGRGTRGRPAGAEPGGAGGAGGAGRGPGRFRVGTAGTRLVLLPETPPGPGDHPRGWRARGTVQRVRREAQRARSGAAPAARSPARPTHPVSKPPWGADCRAVGTVSPSAAPSPAPGRGPGGERPAASALPASCRASRASSAHASAGHPLGAPILGTGTGGRRAWGRVLAPLGARA